MTWDEYKAEKARIFIRCHITDVGYTNIECPQCNKKNVYKNYQRILDTYPPRYCYICNNCGWIGSSI